MKKIILPLLFFTASLWSGLPIPRFLSADFNQSVVQNESNRSLHYKGYLVAALPTRAKWHYTTPIQKTICIDGQRAWVIEPELEQATLYRLGRTIPLTAILKHAVEISPNRYKATYQGIVYTLEVDHRHLPHTIHYTDDLGNHVTLRLSRVDTSAVPDKRLDCTIPDGFDIIDARY